MDSIPRAEKRGRGETNETKLKVGPEEKKPCPKALLPWGGGISEPPSSA